MINSEITKLAIQLIETRNKKYEVDLHAFDNGEIFLVIYKNTIENSKRESISERINQTTFFKMKDLIRKMNEEDDIIRKREFINQLKSDMGLA